MKRGDILLFKSTNWFGKQIAYWGGGKYKYSHSAIYTGRGKIIEVAPFRIKVIPLSKKLDQNYDVWGLPSSVEEDEINYAITLIHMIMKERFKWYGFFNALVFIPIKLFKIDRGKVKIFDGIHGLICSEVTSIYSRALSLIRKKFLNWSDAMITPGYIPEAFKISKEC